MNFQGRGSARPWKVTLTIPSWQRSIPRSKSRSSTLRSASGNRTYSITTRRMTSGEELKRRNGLGGRARDLRGIAPR
jgi:hypothetical protein